MAVEGIVKVTPQRVGKRIIRGCQSKIRYSKKVALKVANNARNRAGEITVHAYSCPFYPGDHYHVGHSW